MRYLIDGHNLIAQMPDLSLEDPNDEAKLVYKLRSFAARSRKKMTVVFDGGLPGGISQPLSNSQVQARFASSEHMTADQILLNTIRKTQNPKDLTVVSSDQVIVEAAQARKIAVLTAPAFIQQMSSSGQAAVADKKEDHPRISPAEVEAWLKIFGDGKKKPKSER